MRITSSSPWMGPNPNDRYYRIIRVDACPRCGVKDARAVHVVRDEDALCESCCCAFWVPAPGLNWQDKHRR